MFAYESVDLNRSQSACHQTLNIAARVLFTLLLSSFFFVYDFKFQTDVVPPLYVHLQPTHFHSSAY